MQSPGARQVDAATSGLVWRKSRHSNPSGNCVEIAALSSGEIAVRNSRNPYGPRLIYTRAELAGFFTDAREGLFDTLL